MLQISHTLERMEVPMTSVAGAIQATREIITNGDNVQKAAAKFIKSLLSIDVVFTDADAARITAFAVVEAVVKNNGEVRDENELYAAAVARAEKHLKNPANAWMYVKAETTETASTETRAVEGTTLSVAVKADGTVKRGGKQQIAAALFTKHVLESDTPCDNVCFVQILMKEAGMSLAGARTYAHNCRKAAGMTK